MVLADLFQILLVSGMSPLAPPNAEIQQNIDVSAFIGAYQRMGQRTDIVSAGDEVLVKITPMPGEAQPSGPGTEFRAGPTSATELLSTGDIHPGGPATLTFSENEAGKFQLMFHGGRLARRIPPAP